MTIQELSRVPSTELRKTLPPFLKRKIRLDSKHMIVLRTLKAGPKDSVELRNVYPGFASSSTLRNRFTYLIYKELIQVVGHNSVVGKTGKTTRNVYAITEKGIKLVAMIDRICDIFDELNQMK